MTRSNERVGERQRGGVAVDGHEADSVGDLVVLRHRGDDGSHAFELGHAEVARDDRRAALDALVGVASEPAPDVE